VPSPVLELVDGWLANNTFEDVLEEVAFWTICEVDGFWTTFSGVFEISFAKDISGTTFDDDAFEICFVDVDVDMNDKLVKM
jgi:hypothetical protein